MLSQLSMKGANLPPTQYLQRTMQTIQHLEEAMERIAPSHLAEEWDNVGLLAGERSQPLRRVLLCIDLTEEVLAESIRKNADAVVAYHPPIFKPLARIVDDTPSGRVILGALSSGIAIHSPHTAADATPGGVNDWLCEGLGKGSGRPLRNAIESSPHQACKVVTFAPPEAVEALISRLAECGAGMIGNYSQCSFQTPGTGTFLGGEGSNPVVGVQGELERAPEVRLEMVCGKSALPEVIQRLKDIHPYEEPAYDVYQLEGTPSPIIGSGRMLTLDVPETFAVLSEHLRGHLATGRLTGCETSPGRLHTHIGICAGSGGDLLDDALRAGCSLFVTGEMSHHDVLKAKNSGCAVLLAGHTNTERGWLKVLRKELMKDLRKGDHKVDIDISRADCDPLQSL